MLLGKLVRRRLLKTFKVAQETRVLELEEIYTFYLDIKDDFVEIFEHFFLIFFKK